MLKKILKPQNNALFICQISEDTLKIAKCLIGTNGRREVSALEAQAITQGLSEKELTAAAGQLLKKLNYERNPLIISLPRNQATSRYIKVPTQSPQEIENIATLQAPRYLPYPSEELVSGYQIVSTEKNGYSNINLIITHKNTVERLIRIFKEFKPSRIDIVLSSYGLVNFYHQINRDDNGLVMIADIDAKQTEVAVILSRKLIFSRAFKFNPKDPGSEALFMAEINKTREACTRETGERIPADIKLTGIKSACEKLAHELSAQEATAADLLKYGNLEFAEYSFAGMVGLGMKDTQASLNLLPRQMKDSVEKTSKKRESLRVAGYITATILILILGAAKNMDNKHIYLEKLKREIAKVSNEARPLEAIEKRMRFVEQRSRKRTSGLDALYEINKNIPPQATLVSFTYEEDKQVILRGQSPELNYVFELVSRLEKSPVFRNFSVKVRYASKKRVQSGEIIDFEIICAKK